MGQLDPFAYISHLFGFISLLIYGFMLEGRYFKYHWWLFIWDRSLLRNVKFWVNVLRYLVILFKVLHEMIAIVYYQGIKSGVALMSQNITVTGINGTESWQMDTVFTPEYITMNTVMDLILNFSFSTFTSSLFLLNCFFATLFAKRYLPESTRFISATEFKFYIVFSIISLIIHPVLQYALFRPGTFGFVAVPQYYHCFECIILCVVMTITVLRLNRVITQLTSYQSASVGMLRETKFYMVSLILCLFLYTASNFFLNIELLGVTVPSLSYDMVSCCLGFQIVIVQLCMICLLNVAKIVKMKRAIEEKITVPSSLSFDSKSVVQLEPVEPYVMAVSGGKKRQSVLLDKY